MPRPRKNRKVCHFPHTLSFAPVDSSGEENPVGDAGKGVRLVEKSGVANEVFQIIKDMIL